MAHVVELSKRAQRELRKLSSDLQERIISCLEALAENPRPHGAEKLAAEENAYRVRVGDYRILYEVRDVVLVVIVMRIGHRRDVYR